LKVSYADKVLALAERAAHQTETHGDLLGSGGGGGGVKEILGKMNVPSRGELMAQAVC
jgi:hypothetical protein